ncbi:MAG: ATP-binding cassette domain-containing protein [Proteobacteria bacterium]|nr:ATP-binding cassette domain-containing protein [Pseudomonadota bacterium]
MLNIENVSFETNGRKILDRVSLNVKKGEVRGLLGPNGSGKTTLLDLISGVKKPSGGNITVDGEIGYLFQFPERNIFAENVFDEIAFWARNLKMSDIDERVKMVMNSVKLDFAKFYKKSPFLLSYGEKRKVSIASILIGEPAVILLDEPDAGLSIGSIDYLVSTIKEYREKGLSFLVVSHNLFFLSEITDKIDILLKGKIEFEGRFEQCCKLCAELHYRIPFKCELILKFPKMIL